MSTPDELVEITRFAKPRPASETIVLGAQQTRAELQHRWGVQPFTGTPDVIRVDVAHDLGQEVWKRRDDGSTGANTNYQLEGSV